MVEEGPGAGENDLPAVEPQPPHDFSRVQGFQLVGADERAGDEAWREALKLELETRVERLRQAVDSAIVLSNDGIVRWLGDPVAKLSAGSDPLNPSAVLLVDDALPVESRATVKARIELWIAAATRRLLAPLLALDGLQEGSEIVRELARELVRSLGVLEREPIKAKIRTLTQDDRAELRKQGVRFGAYYLFLPTLLKPAARALALQLWALQTSGDAGELLRTLGPVASSGRTSLPFDPGMTKDGGRVAGYRTCGERIVRVDVVERLAGMIRTAMSGEPPTGAEAAPQPRPSKGFVVTGAMTSLTGCSGEAFASILRSMGFRPVEMKRSEFFASQPAISAPQEGEPTRPPADEPPAETNSISPPSESDGEAASAAPPATLANEERTDGAEDASVAADLAAEVEDVPADTDEKEVESADGVPEDTEAAQGSVGSIEEASTPAPVAQEAFAPAADLPDVALETGADAEGAVPRTPDAKEPGAKESDVIIVWRPDHRRPQPRLERERKRPRTEGPGGLDNQQGRSAPPPRRRDANLSPPKRSNSGNVANSGEKRRHQRKEYDMSRSAPTPQPPPKAKVDPNSPFAKLLELRSLLEEQANKRH
jgi:ATP-dependent RNA helicase SUPV3L1/SUV3